MRKDWVVVFQDLETGRVKLNTFTAANKKEARGYFWACYRQGIYKILTVIEKPEIAKE